MQLLLDGGQQEADEQHRDDLALVASLGDLDAEDVPELHGAVGDRRGDSPAVDQLGHHHRGAHRRAEVGVATEPLGGREADQHRQEGERGGRQQLDHRCDVGDRRPAIDQRQFAEQALGGEDVVQRHHQAAGDQGRQDRDEDVGDHLDEASEEVALLGGLLGGFGLASLLHTQGDQLVVDVIDIAGTDDDLVHATCREGALDVHVVVERGLVDLLLIIQHQAKTGCAVRCC